MAGVFDEREAEQAEQRHETELTLGSGTLLLIFFGLVLLCGLCFGFGYSMGHRGQSGGSTATVLGPGVAADVHADGTQPKSAVDSQAVAAAEPDTQPALGSSPEKAPEAVAATDAPATQQPASPPTVETKSPPTVAPSSAASPNKDSSPPAAKPAQTKAVNPPQQKPPAAKEAQTPSHTAGPVMVQIAAVSEQEDADVLMGALRKRGYSVVSGRDPQDGLIHVRIGPFKTRDEADTWRQKLLNDGYNAIMQP